jgi:hypothetical protein
MNVEMDKQYNILSVKNKTLKDENNKLIAELKKLDPNYLAKANAKSMQDNSNNANNKLTSAQLRAKAGLLFAKSDEEIVKADDLKNLAATKSPIEKDSLLAQAKSLETLSKKDKIEAYTLNQKANLLDTKQNDKTINGLLTKLTNSNASAAKEFSVKNKEITELKTQLKNQRDASNKITDNLEKIVSLKLIDEKETEILQKQEQLILDLNNVSTDPIAKTNSQLDPKNTNNEANNSVATNNNTKNNTTKNNSSSNFSNEDESADFNAISDIQKTNLEYLEEFGDLSAEDLEFKVQVGVFKKRTTYHFPKLRGLGKVSTERLKDGSTRMTMGGSYKTLRQAFRHNKKITRAGQSDAFVSVYYKGQRIGIENLRRKGVLVKTQVVTDSVSLTKVTINASNLTEYAQIDNGNATEDEPITQNTENCNLTVHK